MPKKFSQAEQRAAVARAKTLAAALPAAHRSKASGIASGLVRLRKNPTPAADVREVLKRYSVGKDALTALAEAGVLTPAGGEAYRIALPDADTGGVEPKAGGDGTAAQSDPGDARADAAAPSNSAADTPKRSEGPRRPHPLARATTIRKQTPELTAVRRRIIDLDPRLWINGYLLSTPDAFVDYERELGMLSAAMERSLTIGDGTLTTRELSYRVFGDEKFLALDSEGRKLLRLMGVADLVRTRHVAKTDLLSFVPRRRRHPRLVLSENLDPWANIRDALFAEKRTRILGKRVDGAVFGNGHLAMGSHQLSDLALTLAAERVRILYWGDLDRAGLAILAAVARDAASSAVPLEVRPFAPAYRLMLKRAMKRFPNPLDNKPTDQTEDPAEGLALLEPHLKDKEAAYLRALLDGARMIPQEIVTAADL